MFHAVIEWSQRLFKNGQGRTAFKKEELSINNPLKYKKMARKTVISKVVEENAQDGIIEFPQNRTLYADLFTENAPNTDEAREGFKAKSMKEVFEHYQPCKNGVELTTEEGGAVYEDFEFRQIKDFEDEQIIANSEMLSEKKKKIDAYNSVIRQLEKNKTLRNALKDPNASANLKNALLALLSEVEKNQ